MKATQKDFASVAPKAAREARVFFFCGPDEAGVQDAAARIAGLLVDPGERIELAGADLRRDPVRLGDEARSTSLFGDARHIFVRASGDEAAEAVEILLAGEAEPCPVLILATGATDKARTAKLLADRKDALVAMFWPPDLKSVAATVRALADGAGVRVDGALAERIARAAGLDTRIARSEIVKLALYLDASAESPRTADAAALDAIGASSEEDGFMPLVNAVLAGEAGKLAAELRRLRELGLNPVGVLLAFERRTAQLAALAARLGPRGDVRALMEAEKAARRVFWKDERDLAGQLKRWRGRRLERLVARIAALHRALLANSQSAELLLAHGLAEITRAASARN
ncbi:MAG: DNA polymerase III subunit delta [Sphingomonadales bacterium]|nr:DNA polymerase III subunit delta [Sphingomonadales bacterium]MBU3993623.1 DNA polymerase III subunit delta [Alphaproteobacteria bacterium]